MRGLIEKTSNPADARSFLYQTTTEFLMHMGLNSVNELPDFAKLVEHIKLPQTPGLSQLPSNPETELQAPIETTAPQTENAVPNVAEPAVLSNPSESDAEDKSGDDE
jgi:hypothetical protein